jgi:hypothetical protein
MYGTLVTASPSGTDATSGGSSSAPVAPICLHDLPRESVQREGSFRRDATLPHIKWS